MRESRDHTETDLSSLRNRRTVRFSKGELQMSTSPVDSAPTDVTKVNTGRRAFVLAIIFVAYLFCYVDRMVSPRPFLT